MSMLNSGGSCSTALRERNANTSTNAAEMTTWERPRNSFITLNWRKNMQTITESIKQTRTLVKWTIPCAARRRRPSSSRLSLASCLKNTASTWTHKCAAKSRNIWLRRLENKKPQQTHLRVDTTVQVPHLVSSVSMAGLAKMLGSATQVTSWINRKPDSCMYKKSRPTS